MTRLLRNILVSGFVAIVATGGLGLYVLFGYDRSFHRETKTEGTVSTLFFDFDTTGAAKVSVNGKPVRLSATPTEYEILDLWAMRGVPSGDVVVRLPANLPVGALKVNPAWFHPGGVDPRSLSLILYSGNKETVVRRDFPHDVFLPTCGGGFEDIRSPGIPWKPVDFDRALAELALNAGSAAYLFVELLPEDTTTTMADILRRTDIPGVRGVQFVILEPGESAERDIATMPGMPPPKPSNGMKIKENVVLPRIAILVARAKSEPR